MMVNFVLIAVVLCGFCGLAVDAGFMQFQKQRMQNAADAAALEAAYEIGQSDQKTAAKADAQRNGFQDGVNGVVVDIRVPNTGLYNGNASAVQATITRTYPTIFMRILGILTVPINARAVALVGGSGSCAYALNPSRSRAFQLAASTATLGCGALIDSSAGDALEMEGGASFTSPGINVVGNAQINGQPDPANLHRGVSAETDPLSKLTQPSFDSTQCKTDVAQNITGNSGPSVLNPGYYCGGINISGQKTVTLNPGLYVITNGINWNGQSTINGTGVTLFFTQGGGYGYGQITISGQEKVNLTAPTDSSLGGVPEVAMFGDRGWNDTNDVVKIDGQSNVQMDGLLYFKGNGFQVTGQSTLTSKGGYLGVVTDSIKIDGQATLSIPNPTYPSGNPFGNAATLVE